MWTAGGCSSVHGGRFRDCCSVHGGRLRLCSSFYRVRFGGYAALFMEVGYEVVALSPICHPFSHSLTHSWTNSLTSLRTVETVSVVL